MDHTSKTSSHRKKCCKFYRPEGVYYLFQDKFKNPKIIKIQQVGVHQKIHTKQFLYFILLELFSICNSFEFKATHEAGLI